MCPIFPCSLFLAGELHVGFTLHVSKHDQHKKPRSSLAKQLSRPAYRCLRRPLRLRPQCHPVTAIRVTMAGHDLASCYNYIFGQDRVGKNIPELGIQQRRVVDTTAGMSYDLPGLPQSDVRASTVSRLGSDRADLNTVTPLINASFCLSI